MLVQHSSPGHPITPDECHSPHCSSVLSGHCCSPSQSQGTGMQPETQAAWREAAHVRLVAAAGKREPGPGSGGAAAPGIQLHSPHCSSPPGGPGIAQRRSIQRYLWISSAARERMAPLIPAQGRQGPSKPARQRYKAPLDAGVPMLLE